MAQVSIDALLAKVQAVRDAVQADGQAVFAGWKPAIRDRSFLAGAQNLAHYLALRRLDLSPLQAPLAAYGLSSLGRSEGHVVGSLDALLATLHRMAGQRMAGEGAPPYPSARSLGQGARTLLQAQDALFGPGQGESSTRIMVTLPTEAASDGALVRGLVEAGMSCARINCAHDDAAAWQAMAGLVREAAAATGRECRVLMDIGGPKCRIETVHAADKVRVGRGDRFALVRSLADGSAKDAAILTINLPEILDSLVVGAEVWINDGRIGTRVVEHDGGRVVLEVTSARAKGERLKPEKGLNFPGTALLLNPITEKDLGDLDTVARLADLVGFSFVQQPQDIVALHAALAERRPGAAPLPVMLKIETRLAVRNLPRLIVQARALGPAAVMIARGDLAVELGFARLSEMQEEIMWLCEAAHVPVVWATQVLEGLVSDGLPTRAETTDAAMAQRAECVMLNKGPFIVEAVAFLADVLRRMDRHQSKKSPRFGKLGAWPMAELGL